MSELPGYGELLQCPYEKAHRIMGSGMAKHLYKCRKNHPKSKMVPCPFNETHHIPQPELKFHTSQCEDRGTYETYKYSVVAEAPFKVTPELTYNSIPPSEPSSGTSKKREKKPASSVPVSSLDPDECWDDMNEAPYNPQKYCESAKVIRKATLKKPAEKKAFYEAERLRLQDLKLTD